MAPAGTNRAMVSVGWAGGPCPPAAESATSTAKRRGTVAPVVVAVSGAVAGSAALTVHAVRDRPKAATAPLVKVLM